MKPILKSFSIRARLLVVYIAILLIGFGGITLLAGQQISASAREDYEQRLKSEISLIAQGVTPTVNDYANQRISDDALQADLATYQDGNNNTLRLILLQIQPAPDNGPHDESRESFSGALELETAIRGEITIDERPNESGEDTLYTAIQIAHDRRPIGLLQLSVPTSNLQALIAQRWLELGLLFAFVTLLGIGSAFWLARSIIQPLYKLRDSAIRLSKGELSHRVAQIGSDEIGEVAHAFNEMAIQIESMLEEQRAFASNTSHELRTPLTTIRLRTEALRYDSTLDEDTAERYVEEVDEEVKRLGNLIQDLTLLSRFDAGRAQLGEEQINMLRFATSLRDQMALIASSKDVSISLVPPPDALTVNASINHLMVVFRNLLDNAIKFTPAGGTVMWKIEQTAEGIRYTIKDTGHGIEADNLSHVFERFYRVDKARSRDIPGTGLGLPLVKSVVEAYGGRITIESDGLDRGTTVIVILPQSLPQI